MDIDDLAGQIDAALEELAIPPDAERMAIGYHIFQNLKLLEPLQQFVAAQPQFSSFLEQWRAIGAFALPLTPESVAIWLILRSLVVGSRSAAESLIRYPTQSVFKYTIVMTLGLSTPEGGCFNLSNDVVWRPYSETEFWGKPVKVPPPWEQPALSPFTPTRFIRSALELICELPIAHHNGRDFPETTRRIVDSRKVVLENIRQCLMLVTRTAIPAMGTAETTDPSLPCASDSFRMSSLIFKHEIKRTTTREEADRAKELHDRYAMISPELRDRLSVPMTRLESALSKGQSQAVDRAIDLGIALESLYATNDEKDELSYRIGMRAGRFLGSDVNGRLAIRNVVKELYTLRSKAVHRGRLSNNEARKKRELEVLDEGANHIATTLERVIAAGSIPEWDQLLLS